MGSSPLKRGDPLPQGGTLEARTSGGILDVRSLGGAREALNWKEPAETKVSQTGPAETKESRTEPAGTLRAPGTERARERTLRAPGTERARERTLRAPGTERALADQRRREVTLAGQQRREVTLAGQRRREVTLALNAAALGMPAARTDTSGASNTQAISPGQRGASAGVVAILAGDMTRADPGLAGTTRADPGLAGKV